jgi:transcription antitermination factor NusG
LNWYACYTYGRHEKRVASILRHRGFESYIATVRTERRWSDRTKVVDVPVFPSYVFGRFALFRLSEVLDIPGVSAVVRKGSTPVAVPDQEIEAIRRLIGLANAAGIPPEPWHGLSVGDQVAVVSGTFRGVTGTVTQLRGKTRLLVCVSAIGSGLSVEVSQSHLRAAPART